MSNYRSHEILKMQIGLKGQSLSQIAAEMGVHPGSVTAVSQGVRRSKRIERALAEAVRTTPEALFPDRYKSEVRARPDAHGTEVTDPAED